MDWLKEGTCTYNFKCPKCGAITQIEENRTVDSDAVRNYSVECPDCSYEECDYAGFEPRQLGGMTKTVFEKNGRVGVRTKFGDGKSVIRSKTKENVLKGKGTQSVLTKGCRDASDKARKEIVRARYNEMMKGVQK